MAQELACPPGVLTKQCVAGPEYLERAKRDITKVADRRCHHIQSSHGRTVAAPDAREQPPTTESTSNSNHGSTLKAPFDTPGPARYSSEELRQDTLPTEATEYMGTVLLLAVGGICFAILLSTLARRGSPPARSPRARHSRRCKSPLSPASGSDEIIGVSDATDSCSPPSRKRAHRRRTHAGEDGGVASESRTLRRCPLCDAVLSPGERIKSVVYSAGKDGKSAVYQTGSGGHMTEAMTHIFGCPHCYPSGRARRCPVCTAELPRDGHLVARMFSRARKRKHVHVLGCTGCRRTR